MARTRQQYYADNVGLKKDGREFYLNDELLAKLENVPSVIDNVTSTSATDALSANMGRVLQDQINQLSSVGTFLSLWDCTTGLPETDPAVNPYQYKTGDYYIVSKIAEEGEDNYRPRGTQYDVGIASTVVETEDIQVGDWYLYDGAKWIKQDNTGKEYPIDDALSLTSRNAVENRVVTAKFDEYYNKDEIDEKEKGYVKFGDNEVDSMDIYISDANGNYIELYPNSFYVENEDGDAEEYDFFGDYRIARLNETMRGFPVPERGDDISNILEILKRNKPVYFYEKNGEAYNIWVVQSFVSQVIKSYMNNKGEYLDVWVNDNGWECDGHSVANADLVYQQSYTWHYLPSNNTWDGSTFSQYRETSSSFTVNGNGLFRMGFEYKLKVKNTGHSTITVTLGNKLLNPRNIPTTVAKGKEVIFLFYSSHNTMSTMELAQRIERPLGGGGEGSSTYPFPSEGDDISEMLEALADGNSVVLAEAPDGLEAHYYTIEAYYPEDDYLEAISVGSEEKVYIYYADGEVSSIDREAFPYLKFSDVQRKNMTGSVAMMTAKQFGYYKDTATNFTISAEPNSDKYSMDKLFKVKNTGNNNITITLGANIENPMNIDTTVKAGEEVIFEFHNKTIGQQTTLWRRTPDNVDLSEYYNKSEVDELLDNKADKSELPTLTTQIQQTPGEPVTALLKDGDNEIRFDEAGNTIQMDITDENGTNTRFLATKEYVDEKTEQATDDTLGTVKTNSEKGIRLDDDGVLEIDGRRGKFPSTTGLYAPDNRDPRNVADYSLLMTDALGMNMTANRSLAIVSGYGVTCQSAPAGSTVYKLSNTYANRLKAKCCEGGFISLDEPTSKVKRIVPVKSVLIGGRTFHPDSVSDSSTPIEITVEETVNPDKTTTSIRLFGTMNSYASLHIGNGVSSGGSGRSLMIGGGITKNNGNDNCMVGMDMYATGNGNAMFGRYHIARKNRGFLAGTGHDTTNARTEGASAVGEYSYIDANTLFAVGNGLNHTARRNAFEVRTNGIVLRSPSGTRWIISVDDSGNLTTTAI